MTTSRSSPGSPDRPRVSIIIVNYNSRDDVLACLAGLTTPRSGAGHEIIVVDNNSADGSAAEVRRAFPNVHLLANADNKMFAGGVNQGIQASRGRYFLILNPDLTITPEVVDRLADYLDAHPDVAAASPVLKEPSGRIQTEFFPRWPSLPQILLFYSPLAQIALRISALRRRWYEVPLPDDDRPAPVEQLSGACMMVSRTAVERAGYMDERFVLFYEDVDWCRRLAAAGPSHVVPALSVIHKGGGSHEKREFWLYGRFRVSMIQYFQKHHSPAAAAAVRTLYHVLSWTGLALRNVQQFLLRRSDPNISYHREKYLFYFKEYKERCGPGPDVHSNR